ncbi:uncharacterized protein A4U43_C04F23660 [Asparagus officinalis]|uniref:Uncharacterized protein n=1 Tax=Asparagus officinalis TaxID=4686 RepID=A0A5P1F7X1_ASPOF|nr:uncharacterized protein A4U43_C04F23660 [Asparagus officinalis]
MAEFAYFENLSASVAPEGFKPYESCLKVLKHHLGESTCALGRKEYQKFEESEEAPFEEAAGYEGSYDFAEPAFHAQYAPSQLDFTAKEEIEEEVEELTRATIPRISKPAKTMVQTKDVGTQVEGAPILTMAIITVIASIPALTNLEPVVEAPITVAMALPPIHSHISAAPELTPTLVIVATGASSQVYAMMSTTEETLLYPVVKM